MHHLPVELHDQITSEFDPINDLETLKALSLSCHILTVPCQKIIFSRIVLRAPLHRCTLMGERGGTSANFKALLENAPHIADFVTCLLIFDQPESDIFDCPVHDAVTLFRDELPVWIPTDELLPTLLLSLQNLRAFGLEWTRGPNDLSKELIAAFHQVVQLPSLLYANFGSFPIFSTFTKTPKLYIRHLVLSGRKSNTFRLDLDSGSTNHPADESQQTAYLESLHWNTSAVLQKASLRGLLFVDSPLENSVSLRRLKKLYVGSISSISCLVEILQECAESLEVLLFAPPIKGFAPSYNEFQNPLNLSRLASLNRFHTFLTYFNCVNTVIQNIPWFVSVLRTSSQYPHTTLQEIVVDLNVTATNSKQGIQQDPHFCKLWDEVADILLGGNFPCLRMFQIFVRSATGGDSGFNALNTSRFAMRMREKEGFELGIYNLKSVGRSRLGLFVPQVSWLQPNELETYKKSVKVLASVC